ncbi:MAG: hypothetical protein WA213_20940 [Terriglobales bacterium]
MKSGLTQCAECGTLTPNDFCSRECEDLFTYGSDRQPGHSLLDWEMGHKKTGKRGAQKKWDGPLPPSKTFDECAIDLNELPF